MVGVTGIFERISFLLQKSLFVFHGHRFSFCGIYVFTLLFGRKFLTYPVTGVAIKMNDRITTLLNPLGLGNHIYSGSIRVIEESIDYAEVHRIMQKHGAKGCELLKEWTR